jgi:hypothetical protein
MIYKRLQHIHLCTTRVCTRREALCYFLLGDSLEQVSSGSETVNQDESLRNELAQSDSVFCCREQFLRDERNMQEVLMYLPFRSQHYAFRTVRAGEVIEEGNNVS